MSNVHQKEEAEVQNLYSNIHRLHSDDWQVYEAVPINTIWAEPADTFKGKLVLEAGCGGIGSETRGLLKLDPSLLFSLDLTHENLMEVRTKVNDKGLVHFVRGSILALPFGDAAFDVVLCKGVVQHLSDPLKGLAELTRVLKPGGKIFISVYSKGGLLSFFSLRLKVFFRRFVPFLIAKRFFSVLFKDALLSGVLDHLYVPFEYRFSKKELLRIYTSLGLNQVEFVWHEVDFKGEVNSKVIYSDRFSRFWFTYINPNSVNRLRWLSRILYGEAGLDLKAVKRFDEA